MAKKLYAMRWDEDLVSAFDESARSRGLTRTEAIARLMRGQIKQDGRTVARDVEPITKGAK